MPKYAYLNDDTPFDAASLNDRFATFVDAINVLNPDSFAEKALNKVHVPSLVTEVQTSENTVANVHTPSRSGTPIEIAHPTDLREPAYLPDRPGYFATLSTSLTFQRGVTRTQPTALLVMANVEVKEFSKIKVIQEMAGVFPLFTGITGINLNEYTWDATVVLVLESSSGVQKNLPRTERQVSPRVTIGSAGNAANVLDPPISSARGDTLKGRVPMSPLRDMPGNTNGVPHYEQFDHKTYQDVAIRTVITRDDLETLGLSDIKHVHLGFMSANSRSYFVQRANVTLLPLLAEVV
jgi:hypothetical protein